MTEEQIQALEALYVAAKGRLDALVDLDKVKIPISPNTLDELRQQGLIGIVGHGHFTITKRGMTKANENRYTAAADD